MKKNSNSGNEYDEALSVYKSYRNVFVSYLNKRYDVNRNVLEDYYQESFIALYDSIQKGVFEEESVSMKTYLIGIGKNKVLNYLRGKRETENIESFANLEEKEKPDSLEWKEKQVIALRYVSTMKEPCSSILSLYYYEEKSMNEIAEEMNYKNASVAKSRKTECMNKLREMVTTRFKKEDLL
ncbi:sigma-70 family RNA polymerase sigma factor [Bacteroidales bacterium OttesenSCG-928-M11]|nr:sigma-70 family RNA polymerase sigma factor [Bacteroidales bacterium OttesenSCG-928-M11]